MKKIYLCCEPKEKKKLQEKANKLYKNVAVTTELLWKADLILIIGKPDNKMIKDIEMAEELKIETLQVTPELIHTNTLNIICDNKMATVK